MATEDNKALLRRAFDEVFNRHNLDGIDQFWAEDYIYHFGRDGQISGRSAARSAVQLYLTAFPDLQIEIESLIAEGDTVVVRYNFQGTHTGPWNSPMYPMPPSGRTVRWSGIGIDRIVNGFIAEEREEVGWVPFLRRIGAIPAPNSVPGS
jgi:steroid delta-isomerase-like uncharacterized protein